MRYTTRTGLAVVVTVGLLGAVPTARAQRMMPNRMMPIMPAVRMTPMMTPNQMTPMMTQMTPMMTAQQAAINQAAFRGLPVLNPNGFGSPFTGTNPYLGGSFNPYSGSFANPYGSAGYGGASRGYSSNGAGNSGSSGYGGSGAGSGGSGGYGDNTGSGGYGDYSGSGGHNSNPTGDYRTNGTGAANTGTSTAEGPRLRALEGALDRARRDPPLTEIASGRALNVLLANLSAQVGRGGHGPDVPLDDGVLSRINVSAKPEGDIGLLRDEGKLKWPASLQSAVFTEVRLETTGVMAEAVRLARSGEPVKPDVLAELAADIQRLKDTVRGHIEEMSPSEYVEAIRYVSGLGECLNALGDPNVSNYFNKTWSAKGRTVAELVPNMAGLYFAPAVPGDEIAYRVLHQALVTFDAGLRGADAK
jgi:hypothetical protein